MLIAQRINKTLGGGLVGPWDVDQLDDGTVEAILALGVDLENMRKHYRAVESAFQRARQRHPTYRKA